MKNTLKRSLSILLAITIIFSSAFVSLSELDFYGVLSVKTKAVSNDGLTFTINDDGDSCSVTACDTAAEGHIIIPNGYNGLPVTRIGEGAFDSCEKIKTIIIPDDVTSIGDEAFLACSSLVTIILPNDITRIGDRTFYGCEKLKRVTIPAKVTYIGENAFYNCDSLTTIRIPAGVTNMGRCIFGACDNLTDINVELENPEFTSIDGVLFNKSQTQIIEYPDGKTSDFYTIPNGVISIGYCAFANCKSLTEIIIPDSVTNVGDGAFESCDSLSKITIPDSVTGIGICAFRWCNSLTSITIPANVTSIGENAFLYCDSLTAIDVDSANKNYASVNSVLFNKTKTQLIQYPAAKTLKSYTIPDSVTSIGEGAFNNCKKLIAVTIPERVTSIGASAFYRCTGLTSVTIPRGVTEIDAYTFSGCKQLGSVKILGDIANIGVSAFKDCTKLESITIPASLKSIEVWAFDSCESIRDVYFSGTRTEWYEVTVDSYNYFLMSANIHYNVSVDEVDNHYDEGTVTTNPTCTLTGTRKYVCSCKLSYTEIIEALGHNYSNKWTIDAVPTCQSNGSKSQHCTRCDAKKNVTVIEPVPHQFSEWEIIKNATSESYGQKVSTCDVCGSTEYAIIEKLICKAPVLKKVTNTANGVKITWNKVKGADSYEVYRKVKGGSYSKVGTTSKIYFTDKKVKSGKQYYYVVKAVNEAGKSSASSYKTIKYLADPTLKTPTSTKSGITLKWSKVTGAQGYVVYRKTGSGSFAKIATVKGVSKVSCVDKSAKKGKKYTYKVKAYYGKTYSAYSNAKTIKDKY